MNISNTIHTQIYNNQMSVATKKDENVNFDDSMNTSKKDDVLEYYYNFCKQFPNITFRLDDIQGALAEGNMHKLGYNDSMNQIGDNYGAHGQCSIRIDVTVIRKMMQDKSYEMNAIGYIEQTEMHYADYERETAERGMRYTDVSFTYDNGRIVEGVGHYMQPFSTEEEVRALRQNEKSSEYIEMLKCQLANNTDLSERLFEMLDKTRNKKHDESNRSYIAEEYDKHILNAERTAEQNNI